MTAQKLAFSEGQAVSFIGGSGRIKSFRPEAEDWFYLVEMAMEPEEPETGRIGFETTILLPHSELTLQQ